MQYKIDKNTIWEDTGRIKVHNYPSSSRNTFSYITRVYREIKKDSLEWKEIDGEPIYFYDMTYEQVTLAMIMGQAEKALNNICKREKFLLSSLETKPSN